MAAAKCRNRRRELTDTLQAVSATREVAGEEGVPGAAVAGGRELQLGVMPALADSLLSL